MVVTIDKNSGYCFGVEYAIQMAEGELQENGSLYCLGDIVHNSMEVERLEALGLKVIDHQDLNSLNDCKVLIRAHGEPPETYATAIKNNIELIDASCPVVLKLQNRVKNSFDRYQPQEGQMVFYGQQGHAEIIGLNGQTNNTAIVIINEADLDKIDFQKPIVLYSQTTKSTEGFYKIKLLIEERIIATHGSIPDGFFEANDSICRQVSNREPQLQKFASEHDVVVFVSGKKSSNGKALYAVCKGENLRSYFIENESELEAAWFEECNTVGICGATSTPSWLMQQVATAIETMALSVAV